jgi:tetratricopeptide (TPR) repeat protein
MMKWIKDSLGIPQDAAAYRARAFGYCDLGRYEEAIADYDKAIALDPKSADAYYNRGIAYYNLELYEKAIADYGKAIALNPKHATAHNNRESAYAALKRYEEASAHMEKREDLKPTGSITAADFQVAMANLHSVLGSWYTQALEELERKGEEERQLYGDLIQAGQEYFKNHTSGTSYH